MWEELKMKNEDASSEYSSDCSSFDSMEISATSGSGTTLTSSVLSATSGISRVGQDEEKKRLRRERNKLAAARCRQRRVDLTNQLLAEAISLEDQKSRLEKEIENLDRHRNQLEFVLSAHSSTCTFLHQPLPHPPYHNTNPSLDLTYKNLPQNNYIHEKSGNDFGKQRFEKNERRFQSLGGEGQPYNGMVYREERKMLPCLQPAEKTTIDSSSRNKDNFIKSSNNSMETNDNTFIHEPIDFNLASTRVNIIKDYDNCHDQVTHTNMAQVNKVATVTHETSNVSDPQNLNHKRPVSLAVGCGVQSSRSQNYEDLGLESLMDGHTALTPITGCQSLSTPHVTPQKSFLHEHPVDLSPTTLINL